MISDSLRLVIHADTIAPFSGGLAQTVLNAKIFESLGADVSWRLPPRKLPEAALWILRNHSSIRQGPRLQLIPSGSRAGLGADLRPSQQTVRLMANHLTAPTASGSSRRKPRRKLTGSKIATHYGSPTHISGLLESHSKSYLQHFSQFDKVLFESYSQAQDSIDNFGLPSELVFVCPPAVDELRLSNLINTKVVARGNPAITMVGSLQERKGQNLAIAAMPEIRIRFPNAELNLVGDLTSSYAQKSHKLAHDLGIADIVHFWGHRTDSSSFIASSDVFLNLSSEEGVSLSLREASYLGVATVASAIPGNLELLAKAPDGQVSFVSAGSVSDQLPLALTKLDLYRTRTGLSFLPNDYSWDANRRHWQALFEELKPDTSGKTG